MWPGACSAKRLAASLRLHMNAKCRRQSAENERRMRGQWGVRRRGGGEAYQKAAENVAKLKMAETGCQSSCVCLCECLCECVSVCMFVFVSMGWKIEFGAGSLGVEGAGREGEHQQPKMKADNLPTLEWAKLMLMMMRKMRTMGVPPVSSPSLPLSCSVSLCCCLARSV